MLSRHQKFNPQRSAETTCFSSSTGMQQKYLIWKGADPIWVDNQVMLNIYLLYIIYIYDYVHVYTQSIIKWRSQPTMSPCQPLRGVVSTDQMKRQVDGPASWTQRGNEPRSGRSGSYCSTCGSVAKNPASKAKTRQLFGKSLVLLVYDLQTLLNTGICDVSWIFPLQKRRYLDLTRLRSFNPSKKRTKDSRSS